MMFHKLALHKIIVFLKLDEIFKEEDCRKKKQKVSYKTMLQIDQTMDTYVSILLSVITMLTCLTIPMAALEDPCEMFKEQNMHIMYEIASWITGYAAVWDRLILVLFVVLTCVVTKTFVDAVLATNISMSPWLERGKYCLPPRSKSKYY